MTKIQIILLFTTASKLESGQREKLVEIVRESYMSNFRCSPDEVEAIICDGKSENNKSDIVLAISTDHKTLNEGVLRSAMKKDVAKRLMLLFPKRMGFCGNVMTKDGMLDVSKPEPAQEKEPAGKESGSAGENKGDMEMDYKKRAELYQAEEPRFKYSRLKLAQSTLDQIDQALARIELEKEVFEDWGLYEIMPNPTSAMSFYGPPGTGKSMAADAIADRIGKKIIRASYADIESKYHGEGPKNVCALFLAAEQQDAVLFIDEAESLLSKRLTNVNQGSEQAINSMRSQLLICLEKFHGIVIFATNLVVSYDKAFLSRLINIKFELPDEEQRARIWEAHLLPSEDGRGKLKIPLADDVDTEELGRDFPVCGRNIRNAVVNACVAARRKGMTVLTQEYLRNAIADEMKRDEMVLNAEDHTLAKPDAEKQVRQMIKKAVENKVHEIGKEEI